MDLLRVRRHIDKYVHYYTCLVVFSESRIKYTYLVRVPLHLCAREVIAHF